MTGWDAMPPATVCDLLEVWARAPWPMTRPETAAHAVTLGWVVDADGFIDNPGSGVTSTAVDTTASKVGEVWMIGWHVTDSVREPSAERDAFLGDAYAAVVHEATSRWGEPRTSREDGVVSATWEHPSGARPVLARADRRVSAGVETPSYAVLQRRADGRSRS